MTGFDELIGQNRQIRWLTTAVNNDTAPQAILFTGQEGVGKKTAAVDFAMAANCKHRHDRSSGPENVGGSACGQCRCCKKIVSGNHPDFHHVFASGAYIRIDQVRALGRALALKPYEAAVRVVLISDAHKMNAEAGNALLKALEEPPGRTVFILTAPQASDLLPTVVSRCQHIRFNPIPQETIETYLIDSHGVNRENAVIIASLAGGSFTRAAEIAADDWGTRRDRIIAALEEIGQQPTGRDLCFSEMLTQQKETLGFIFEIMKNWFRDMAVIKYRPELVSNRDIKDRLASAAKRYSLHALVEKSMAVEQAERAIAGNANVRLALDVLVLKLARN
ncbi:MAG: DNA polymerase III subunit delta' [Thermodesulfobacteriota bacterium]